MSVETGTSILTTQKRALWKTLLFQLIIWMFFLLPIPITEWILVSVGYGINPEPFQASPLEPDFYVENPNYVFKFHPALPSIETLLKNQRSLTNFQTRFSKVKAPGTLRGFVIGESSAAGFPYFANHAFGPLAARAFVGDGPEAPVEIINAAYSAMTSHYLVDIARRLPSYDPDFVVIYAGHNEYYGTISQSTGGNALTRRLFVVLRNFRLFQWISTVLAPSIERDPNLRLMAKRFQNQRYPLDGTRDAQVTEEFLSNLKLAVDSLTAHEIKVYIYEPVSNVLSMPPFRGSSDAAADLVSRLVRAVGTQNRDAAEELLPLAAQLEAEIGPQPDITYLRAHADAQTGHFDLSDFLTAKDQDWVPFRARESLIQQLKTWASEQSSDKVSLIPTAQQLIERYGERIFSRSFFLEHVHPNIEGHALLAQMLADKLVEDYPELRMHMRRGFFDNPSQWKAAIHYEDVFEINSLRSMVNIATAEPYTGMRVPMAEFWKERMSRTPLFRDPLYQQTLNSTENQDPLAAYFTYLELKKDSVRLSTFYHGLALIYPGSAPFWKQRLEEITR